ncbi:MAG: GIY-YIG nuclease family protein [Planctomycetaceae bacterium]|nr:GIY-YIG nuclease family protein [Planctomycetaceae bacterium]
MFDPECNMLKIGVTNSISRRVVELPSKDGESLRLIKAIPGGRDVERSLHRRVAESRIPGTEWLHVRRSLESWVGQPLARSGRPRPEDVVDSRL